MKGSSEEQAWGYSIQRYVSIFCAVTEAIEDMDIHRVWFIPFAPSHMQAFTDLEVLFLWKCCTLGITN